MGSGSGGMESGNGEWGAVVGTVSEVGQRLKDCAWRAVKKGWVTEAQEGSKLSVLQNLVEGGKARCVQVERNGLRRILSKVRGGTAELPVETGRCVGMKRMVELVDDFDQWEKEVVLTLDGACDDGRAGRAVERVWARRFL